MYSTVFIFFGHIILFGVENRVMNSVQQTEGGIPPVIGNFVSSAQPVVLMSAYTVL